MGKWNAIGLVLIGHTCTGKQIISKVSKKLLTRPHIWFPYLPYEPPVQSSSCITEHLSNHECWDKNAWKQTSLQET